MNKNIIPLSVKCYKEGLPPYVSIGCAIGFIFSFLWTVEHVLRHIFASVQHLHPLLEDETNRNILSRHIGVDAFSCFSVAFLGWKARHVLREMWEVKRYTKAYDNRLFQYHPEAVQIMIFFIGFQFKNLVDTIIWNDGPEFLAHHVLAIFSGSGGLVPGACHFYAVFYFGLSELSTGILCLLANFDDDHGVPGLGEALPVGKMVFGSIFALSFVLIRVVCWGTLTNYYFRDIWQAFQDNHPKLVVSRRVFLYLNSISLGLITLLQIVWLFEIFKIAKSELTKMGVFG